MAEVLVRYNPYKLETSFACNGKEITEESKLYALRTERLQVWVDRLPRILSEECNDDAIHVVFHGTFLDYEDLAGTLEESEIDGVEFTHAHIPAKESDDKFRELVALFDEMQAGPFDDLKDAQIQENFRKALGSEFEVSVIATMSSGKSTLINAMLGQELVPSKNEACTATIARVRDVDGMEGFTASCLDENLNVVIEEQPADLEAMKRFNEDKRVSYIHVNGDIPFVQTRRTNLILVDTPGPNNSRNTDHADHTYRVIKNDAKPLVLYVLNATQLATDDDNELLRKVSEAMKVGGKQSKDRFLFAVNKIDQYDVEREDNIEEALRNTRNYLEKHEIFNPNLYPTSAETAKVIRLHQRGAALTRRQESTLSNYDLFNDFPNMHLTQYTNLPTARKRELEEEARHARESGDHYAETLIHSGVPALEEAINEYLDKYAVTAKIKNAVDTFRKKVEEKMMFDMLLKSIEHNSGEKERINVRLRQVELQLQEGKATSAFKTRLSGLTVNAQSEQGIEGLQSKVELMIKGLIKQPNRMTVNEAEQALAKTIRKMTALQSDVKTELEKLVSEGLLTDAERLLAEYTSYIQSLMEDGDVHVGQHALASETFILGDLPDSAELIKRHKREEREKTGEEEVRNESKRWYKPTTWFQPKYYTRDIFETREYVDGNKMMDEFLQPVRGEFYENIIRATKHMKEETERLKKFFLSEIDKLEAVIKRKVVELKELTGDSRALELRIRDDREKIHWLNGFIAKLDAVLEI
ncbi:dynamin family protein [Cohnella fermenti]|uniref:GTPase n=1 Tax=Cohnella fermenti TaxID=2565925 RepID=A0A4S4BWS7_9BACL|nr:dynamin family protein [Cohnella fermenti]THF77542.1 GTPase [Cohnella fermenti]